MRKVISLDGEWQLWHCKDGQGHAEELQGIPWLKATVPGCAHHDLLQLGRIDDPFFEKNTRKLYDLEEHEWWYRTEFDLPADFTGDRVEILFEGLDTFATIWLNGTQIGSHDNMFVPVTLDATHAVKPGELNELVVRLASPIAAVQGLPLEGAHATMNTPERLWARKPDQCYGWDIAPRILTAGVWRPVRLIARSRATIGDDFLRVTNLSPSPASPDEPVTASISHEVPVEILSGSSENLTLRVEGVCRESEFSHEAPVADGLARFEFDLPGAMLWWTWDLGEPNLYDLTITLLDGEEVIDRRRRKQGLRTARLIQEDQGDSKVSYLFELNGARVFARGMNWTPASSYHALAEGQKHRELLDMCRRMNLNMIRVWGGGVYEPDAWFAQLDELGIMVYQDFMMACAVYPLHQDFLDIMSREARAIITKLRNFACLVSWSGDNENDCAYWGWFGDKVDVRENAIVRRVLPEVIEKFDGTRDYVPSSPYSPDPDVNPQDQTQGDNHVWHHGVPFEDPVYTQDQSRFISEIGHLSCPALATMTSFLSPSNLWPNDHNTFWDHHIGVHEDLDFRPQRRKALDDSIVAFFGEKPGDLETYILASQICQGEAYKLWTEHCRRRKGNWDCGGILLWNVADCWPQISDAVIDYCLRPKLACNYVRWACRPVHISFMSQPDGALHLHVVNDTLAPVEATYQVDMEFITGSPERRTEGQIVIPPNSSQTILNISDLAKRAQRENADLAARLLVRGDAISYNRHRFRKPTLRDIPRLIAETPTF